MEEEKKITIKKMMMATKILVELTTHHDASAKIMGTIAAVVKTIRMAEQQRQISK